MKHSGAKKMTHLTLIAAGMSAFLLACRPPNQAGNEAMDLDLLVSGGKIDRGNLLSGGCGTKYTTTQETGKTDAEKIVAEFVRAKSAIPKGVLKLFTDWGVEITMSSNILGAGCKAQFEKAASQARVQVTEEMLNSIGACVVEKPMSNGRTGYNIVVKSTEEAIHNWLLVTSFSLVYHVFDKFSADASAQSYTTDPKYKEVQQYRKDIASAFIQELQTTTGNQRAIDIFQRMFSNDSSANLASSSRFQSLVLSELSDAYYCSSNTWKPSKMPNTKAVFSQFATKYLESR